MLLTTERHQVADPPRRDAKKGGDLTEGNEGNKERFFQVFVTFC